MFFDADRSRVLPLARCPQSRILPEEAKLAFGQVSQCQQRVATTDTQVDTVEKDSKRDVEVQ